MRTQVEPFARHKRHSQQEEIGPYWGECKFSDGMTIERVLMTPDMAAEFLTTMHPEQRTQKKMHLASMIRDIRDGRWRFTGECIQFDDEGHLINGQHRCSACVEAGIPIDVVIMRGVPTESYQSIDNTSKRSGADAIRMRSKNATTIASALSVLHRWDNKIPINSTFVASPTLIADTLAKHPGINDSGYYGAAAAKITRSPAAATFCHYIFSRIDRPAADQFMDLITYGENIERGNPVFAFRQRFINSEQKLRIYEVIFYLVVTWNSWRQGREVFVLKTPAPGTKIPTPI